MIIATTILALSLVMWWARMPVFEAVFGALLLVPIVIFPLVRVGTPGALVCGGALLGILGWFVVLRRGGERSPRLPVGEALESSAVFVVLFLFNYSICLLWPDFIAMGERLRDYAILASVYHSPVTPREPWLTGFPLNYYLYWYRFGEVLGTLGRLEIWELYHQLQAFTFALFGASIFHLLRRSLGMRRELALVVALAIIYGSNLAGVWAFLHHDTNWWGPSRVIPGAINEFPVWSFLLGDLHPHYLNLCLAPFLGAVALALLRWGGALGTVSAILVVGVSPLWFFNANAWEVPLWVAWSGLGFAALLGVVTGAAQRGWFRDGCAAAVRSGRVWSVVGVGIYLAWSLYLSSRNIAPGDTPLRLVGGTISRSGLGDLLQHWGVPLILIAAGLVGLRTPGPDRWLAGLMVGCSLLARDAVPFLAVLGVLAGWRCIEAVREARRTGSSAVFSEVVVQALGVGAIFAVMLPEFVFLDDPYGGENERMNTIFKVYAASWWLLNLYAVTVVIAWMKRCGVEPERSRGVLGVSGLVLVLLGGFFLQTIEVRRSTERSVQPLAQGLSGVEKRFPGAAGTIQELAHLPRGVVLEAQGPAYDYTTHVATLSGNEAFLGWANHVNLLTREYGEITRREQVTAEIYTGSDCAAKRTVLGREGITYVVFGPLEQKKYPNARVDTFGCLRTIIERGSYRVFAP